MIQIRKSEERGQANWGWLKARHSFSFGEYHDPNHMGFRELRVMNEDLIEPGRGFGTHSHRDMEIVTYVYEGMILHKDSMGNQSVLREGEIQRMSAGWGIEHSEYNGSVVEPLRLLQIWIQPDQKGVKPGYEQRAIPDEERQDQLSLIVSPDGREHSLKIHQDISIYSAILMTAREVRHSLSPDRHAWVQLVKGGLSMNGNTLQAGDGAAVSQEKSLHFVAHEASEFLLFDLN